MTGAYRVDDETVLAYATPILSRQVAHSSRLNSGLEPFILARERDHQGVNASNVGGWHSAPDLCNWPCVEVRDLVHRISEASVAFSKLA